MDKDVDGYIATDDDEGYYYGRWRGLQTLMDKAGMDAVRYRFHPAMKYLAVYKRKVVKILRAASSSFPQVPIILLLPTSLSERS